MNHKITNGLDVAWRLFRYNLKIIFANKFVYFLIAALAIFVLITMVSLFSANAMAPGTVYYLLMVPGLLIVFYPTTFGIQNDVDMRMIEIIFGIPNYRYKVWLVRLALMYLVVFVILFCLSLVSLFSLTSFSAFEMVFQLMFPIFFMGSLAFLLSTLIRNGNGTAVAVIVIGMGFWIAGDALQKSKWNLFLNPFSLPADMNETVWASVISNNRVILVAGILLCVLWGLLNLQQRERYIS